MKNSRERERVPVPRRRTGLALGLLSILVLGGWSDCCCCHPRTLKLADPIGWGPRKQPQPPNAFNLFAGDAGPYGKRVAIAGYKVAALNGDSWVEGEVPKIEGRSPYVTSGVYGGSSYHVGTLDGLYGLNLDYGSRKTFSGLGTAGVWKLLPDSAAGGILVGVYSAPGPGTALVEVCMQSTLSCTAAVGGPVSTKAGDGVYDLRGFEGPPYYVATSLGVWSSPDGIFWYPESSGLPGISYYGIGGRDGSLVVSHAGGASKGAGRGLNWFADNVGLGTNCRGVTYVNGRFFIGCNAPTPQVYTRLETDTSWSSTGLVTDGFVGSLEKDGTDVVAGATVGTYRYRNGSWSALIDCLERLIATFFVGTWGTTIGAGGSSSGYSESTDDGKTWKIDPSTVRLSVLQAAYNSLGTYFTGPDGTFFRQQGQTAFQKLTVPNTQAYSLGTAGDTVLGGLFSGGVGRFNGATFIPANNGFDTTAAVNGFASAGNTAVALTNKGTFWASDATNPTWVPGAKRSDGQPFVGYSATALPDGNFLLGGYSNPSGWNVAISNPSGTTLSKAGVGIPDSAIVYRVAAFSAASSLARLSEVHPLAAASTNLFAATSNGLYVSFDGAATWSLLSRELGSVSANSVAVNGSSLWVATSDRGLVRYSLPIQFRRLVPIVLDVDTGAAHYTTELSVTNRGAGAAGLTLQYTASLGSGSGTVTDTVAAGRQLVIPDVLAYLRAKGLAIPAGGSQGGTLLVTFDNVSAQGLPSVTAVTTAATGAPFPAGRAGLAYPAVDPEAGTTGSLTVYGLRTNAVDRSNLAVFNTSNEAVSVKVTAYSGSGNGASSVVADGDTLPAWGWKQYNRILDGRFDQGWVTVERTSTTGSFGIYGVVNNNQTNDGSMITPGDGLATPSYVNVPVIVEMPSFVSELVLANSDALAAVFHLTYAESLAGSGGGSADVTVGPRSQVIIANALDYLRTHGVSIGAAGGSYAGMLHVQISGASAANTFVAARTSSPSVNQGAFGVFTPAFTPGSEGDASATISGLRSDSENRSNVAAANTGGPGDGSITLSVQAFDGDAGGVPKGAPGTLTLAPGRWQQLGNFLGSAGVSNGWVMVTRTAGTAPWIAYGVRNDGGAPGQRTGDGSYNAMEK